MEKSTDQNDILESLARRIVCGEFVPFIGSGCSRELLGGNDWPGITLATADALGVPFSDEFTVVARMYEERHGREGLRQFLQARLHLEKWDDVAGYPHLALMELRFPRCYTTNVDNAVELCYETYNRTVDVVVTPQDLKAVRSGTPTLVKFHGDLADANSLVWTDRDYARRLEAGVDEFMHILLRADLIVKSLFFIGYSLSDPHLSELISRMRDLYPVAMRESVLISYGNPDALRGRAKELGITLVDTAALYPDRTPAEALSCFLAHLGVAVKRRDVDLEVDKLFMRGGSGSPMLSDYALRSFEGCYKELSQGDAAKSFRATLDGHMIPKQLQERVAKAFEDLCLSANAGSAEELKAALFNLRGESGAFYVQVYAAAYTLQRFGGFHEPIIKRLADDSATRVRLTALAYILMRERGVEPGQGFSDWVARARYGNEVLEQLEPQEASNIKSVFEEIFASPNPRENPLTRQAPRTFPGMKNFQDIQRSMMQNWPSSPPKHGN